MGRGINAFLPSLIILVITETWALASGGFLGEKKLLTGAFKDYLILTRIKLLT